MSEIAEALLAIKEFIPDKIFLILVVLLVVAVFLFAVAAILNSFINIYKLVVKKNHEGLTSIINNITFL